MPASPTSTCKEGRFITEEDELQRRERSGHRCQRGRQRLFPVKNTTSPERRCAWVATTLKIIGVLEKRKAGFFGENEEDNAVLIPFRTAQKLLQPRGFMLFIIRGSLRPAAGSADRSRKTSCGTGAA